MKRKLVSTILTNLLILLVSFSSSAQGINPETNGINYRNRSNTSIKEGVNSDNLQESRRKHINSAVTTYQQSYNKKDVEITQKIRRELLEDKDLSKYSKNIKVVTNRGKVVVTGPVRTSEEKKAVDTIAKNIAGDENVLNQISIKR